MYQTLLFDLDGTLTDSGPGIIHSAAYALEKMGIADDNSSHLSRFIGPPLYESFAQFYGLNAAETQQAVDYFREYFTSKGIFENHPYPGIPELLGKLQEQGKTLLIATSKPEIFAKQILAHLNWTAILQSLQAQVWMTRAPRRDRLLPMRWTNWKKSMAKLS